MTRRRRLLRWLARSLVTIAVDAVVWAFIQSAAGYRVHRISVARLSHDTWVTRPRRWECGGAFYADRLRIRRWKRLLPEAGAVFAGGFDKGKLGPRSAEHLRRHAAETRRAETGHWLALLPIPLFWRWNPRWLAIVMSLYAVAVNGPCIAAQRYNRLRLQRVMDRLGRGERVEMVRPRQRTSPRRWVSTSERAKTARKKASGTG